MLHFFPIRVSDRSKRLLIIMPEASRAHIGQCRTVRVSGFGFMEQGFNGDYGLDLSQPARRVYRRKAESLGAGLIKIAPSQISIDGASGAWVLTSDNGHQLSHLAGGGRGRPPTPVGAYEGGVTVAAVVSPGSLVGSLAFPAPRLDPEYHAANGVSIVQHSGFVSLRTAGTGPVETFTPLGRGAAAPPEAPFTSLNRKPRAVSHAVSSKLTFADDDGDGKRATLGRASPPPPSSLSRAAAVSPASSCSPSQPQPPPSVSASAPRSTSIGGSPSVKGCGFTEERVSGLYVVDPGPSLCRLLGMQSSLICKPLLGAVSVGDWGVARAALFTPSFPSSPIFPVSLARYLKRPGSRFTVLYSHGNAEDLGLILDYLVRFNLLCLSQLTVLARSACVARRSVNDVWTTLWGRHEAGFRGCAAGCPKPQLVLNSVSKSGFSCLQGQQ